MDGPTPRRPGLRAERPGARPTPRSGRGAPADTPTDTPGDAPAPGPTGLRRLTAPFRKLTEGLGFRITFLLALALLPLAILSAGQTVSLSQEAQSRAEAAILGDTVRVAAPVLQHILRAQGAAATLASAVAEVDTNPEACHQILSRFAGSNPIYTLVGFIPVDGLMTCSGDGRSHDFNANPAFRDAIKDSHPSFEVSPPGPTPGSASLIIVSPVTHRNGLRSGLIMLSIPQHALEVSQADAASDSGNPTLRLFTFDGSGNVLTATDGIARDGGFLPRYPVLKDLAGPRSIAFTATARNGQTRIFGVAPIVVGKLYALSSWPADVARGDGIMSRLPPMVLPILMAVVSLFAAWMAAEHLVLRHIRRLRKEIRAFAGGGRILPRPARREAPLEIREVQESFARMTETILRDEAGLEDAIHQKEVLLREVHHRIKNNLQLIASIMSLQMRRERATHVRAILKNLQDRVMSLATIHRGLYQTTGESDVHADELLSGIVGQVLSFSTGPGRRFAVETAFDEILLTPDQAVPLSLLLTEALTNAMKYGAPAGDAAGARATLTVSLRRDPQRSDHAVLTVANSLAPQMAGAESPDPGTPTESSGFGSHLIEAFARQLGGTIASTRDATRFTLRLDFAITPLHQAERREAGDASAPPETRPRLGREN